MLLLLVLFVEIIFEELLFGELHHVHVFEELSGRVLLWGFGVAVD